MLTPGDDVAYAYAPENELYAPIAWRNVVRRYGDYRLARSTERTRSVTRRNVVVSNRFLHHSAGSNGPRCLSQISFP